MENSLKLGIAGLGTVGCGVIRLLQQHGPKLEAALGRSVKITAICASSREKDRGLDHSSYRWVDDALDLAGSPDIDVFVELIGGEEGVARASIERAIDCGKHVVTANKALLAHHGTALAKRAESHRVALNFEAAVAGGIPIIKTMRESLIGNDVSRVYGILNGTCNYILTLMQSEGRSFDDVLAEAQRKGFAEADPTFDIGGFDAAHKLALLTAIAFGTEVAFEDVYVEGIERITASDIAAADELGYAIKLLGVAQRTDSGIEQRVHPAMVPRHSPIAEVHGVTNCVALEADYAASIMLVGPGAGAGPTASSVVSDIVDIARGDCMPAFARPASSLAPYERARMRAHEGGYYIRLSVHDRPGAFAAIARRMADQNVSLDSIVQKRLPGGGSDRQGDGLAPVVLITHETSERAIRQALEGIEADGFVAAAPQMIRIEPL